MSADRVISAVDVSDWCTRHATLKPHSSLDRQPMQLVIGEQMSGSVWHRLKINLSVGQENKLLLLLLMLSLLTLSL